MQERMLAPEHQERAPTLSLVPSLPARQQTRLQTWIGRLIQTVFVANILIILGLWASGGNVTDAHTESAVLTSLGRLAGLLAAYFLLIQVLLLARLPFLKSLAGFDRLAVWHRWNGRLTVLLILAHVGFIIAGYALADRLSAGSEAISLLTNYSGMVQAFIGTFLLILVGVTSAVIVRRRLRYEAWYAVHLMAYLGIFLAWFHQIPTGSEFVLNPVAAAYWTALYLVTLQLVVLFRVVQPLLRGAWHGMRVAEVIPEGPGVVSLRITGRRLDWMDVRAGQFFLWRFLAPGVWRESHPFSLSAAPRGGSLRITVKALGDFSSRLAQIKPGTRVMAEGPFGSFTEEVRQHDRAVLIAAGIGITPIRALLEEMGGDLTLIYRAVSGGDLIFRTELDLLAGHRGITVHYVVGDHRLPEYRHLLSAPHLRHLVPDITDRDVYLCGPGAMMRSLKRTLRRLGVARASIHTDEFSF